MEDRIDYRIWKSLIDNAKKPMQLNMFIRVLKTRLPYLRFGFNGMYIYVKRNTVRDYLRSLHPNVTQKTEVKFYEKTNS